MIIFWVFYKMLIEIILFFLKIIESFKFVKFEKLYKLMKNDMMIKRFIFYVKNKLVL